MTPEASLTKLSYLLSRSDLSLPEKRKLMEENLRGEKTVIDEKSDPQSLLLDMSLLKSLTKLLTSNTVTPSTPLSLSLNISSHNQSCYPLPSFSSYRM